MDVLSFLSRTSTEKERIKEDRHFASLKPIEGDGTERRRDYVLRRRKYGYRLRIRQVTYVYKLTRIQYCGKEVSRGLSRGRKKTRAFIDPDRRAEKPNGLLVRAKRAFLSYRRKVPMATGFSAFLHGRKNSVTQLQIFLFAGNRGERAHSQVTTVQIKGKRRSAEERSGRDLSHTAKRRFPYRTQNQSRLLLLQNHHPNP